MRYEHIVHTVFETPWAILPQKLAVLLDVLSVRVAGGYISDEEVREVVGAAARPQTRGAGMVAVLPIMGTIAHRMDMLMESSGGTSTNALTRSFRAALADPDIAAIVFDVDSPGGMVSGVPELADEIFKARGQKPMVAIADTMAASAAYWLATAADGMMVAPSGEVGSIGVLCAHQDLSGYYDKQGVKTTLIAAGPFKTEGNPYEPLTDEARVEIQASVDEFYGMFVKAVAKHRGVAAGDVRENYGQGRVLSAERALKAGMVDRIGTLDMAISWAAQMAGRPGHKARASSEDERARAVLAGV